MVSTQNTVTDLKKQVEDLKEKREDMEGRMRRGNIWTTGFVEQLGSSSPTAVSKLLKEVFQMDKDVVVECLHCDLKQREPGDKPCVIIAKLHNEGDAMDILRKAWDGNLIAIFPEYSANVAKAWVAFTDVMKIL